MVIAGIDFFTLDFFESPKYFYLFFIGLPLLAIGFNLTSLGYGSKLAAYQSREMAPVAKDTFNYLANETTGSIEKIAQAAQKGKSTVVEAKQCGNCQELNKIDAKFCNECGKAL
ncbi:zinc ribbon domain-containing protein [Solibacillus sp. MA9]|uniref:Zinc ribbon domain-containing protein n=1 Tax=Solibacillus palustris TaxID=2908203 RepID=A0ABS9UAK8_9BACL|nr:zinc ribbon domain-containing protein [Solibacillus sp. MA9]MCH7321204.1 zinc ribbon domain-containing protein [Solibacillus sp. MA9]